jgi:PAP2 superfamily.
MTNLDTEIFLFLNSLHADWLDPIMVAITNMVIWMPFYLLLVYFTIKQYGIKSIWIFLGVAFVVLCSDQISAHVFKPLFQRLRPCHEPCLEGLIHLPKGKAGGQFGFISSHATNTFALATFITYVLKPYYKSIGYFLFVWALLSSYSRIYVGVHYPGDIIAGVIVGLLIGWGIWKIFNKLIYQKYVIGSKS